MRICLMFLSPKHTLCEVFSFKWVWYILFTNVLSFVVCEASCISNFFYFHRSLNGFVIELIIKILDILIIHDQITMKYAKPCLGAKVKTLKICYTLKYFAYFQYFYLLFKFLYSLIFNINCNICSFKFISYRLVT